MECFLFYSIFLHAVEGFCLKGLIVKFSRNIINFWKAIQGKR